MVDLRRATVHGRSLESDDIWPILGEQRYMVDHSFLNATELISFLLKINLTIKCYHELFLYPIILYLGFKFNITICIFANFYFIQTAKSNLILIPNNNVPNSICSTVHVIYIFNNFPNIIVYARLFSVLG